MVCPYQILVFMTYPITESANITSYTKMAQPGMVQYTIHVMKGYRYESDVKIVANSRKVDQKNLLFSKCACLLTIITEHLMY